MEPNSLQTEKPTEDRPKHNLKNAIFVVVIGLLLLGGYFVYQNLRGVGPAINSPSQDIVDLLEDGNQTEMPLKLPEGFRIEIFAKNLPGARVIAQDGMGNFWISRTSAGVVTMLEMKDGKVVELTPGSLFYIPPTAHDSWVIGDEDYVSLHFLGGDQYAK